MKISLVWISEFVDIGGRDATEVAESLTRAGLEVEGSEQVGEDTVLEISVTPNRPDWLSHVGVARELAAIYDLELKLPDCTVLEHSTPVEAMTTIDIEAPEGCSRYSGRVITGIRIGPSPDEISKRLESLGVRNINNVVDATNYVMLELGQPLHAFDYHRLAENRIVVRKAKKGERLKTLDEQERILEEQDLLICDGVGPVAMAGIMGGESSEVHDETVDLLLESACFDPGTIRRSSKRLSLSTEASYRFERGTDPSGTVTAVDRLAHLVQKWAGGEICAGAVDTHPRPEDKRVVEFNTGGINAHLGTNIPGHEMVGILERLALKSEKVKEDLWKLNVPGFRRDIAIEEDIAEEVARIFGYQNIPITMPIGRTIPVAVDRGEKALFTAKVAMEGMGFSEAVTYSFIRESDLHDLGLTGGPDPVRVLNPISEDMSVMRTSLLPGLLQSLQLNLSRRIDDVRLYEIGRVFLPCEGCEVSEERFRIAAVMTGCRNEKNWSREREESNFYDIKGAAENLLAALGIRDVSFQEMEMTYLQPGQSAWVVLGDRSAGPVGTVHPRIMEKYDIRSWAGCFELDISVIRDVVAEKSQYRPYSRFPGVLRDMALIVPSDSTSGEIEETILASATGLQYVRLFDLYKGEGIPDGSRSLGFTLHFQSFERTLTDEEVDKNMKKILDTLEGKYGAKLRW